VRLRGRAAALVLGALVAGCALAACSPGAPPPEPTGTPGVDVLALSVGDCLDLREVTGATATVPVVDCASEHDSEAYGQIVLDDGPFPGAESIKAAAESGCVEQFAEFVGLAYDSSSLDYAYYFPTEGSWEGGDRRILCLVGDPAARVSGSLEGAAR